jgi:hypothetical protein
MKGFTMISQKDSVFTAYEQGKAQNLTGKDLATFASTQVALGLMQGEVEHSTPEKFLNNEKEANKYAKELVSNWFRRDQRINGGVKYVPETKRGPIVKNADLKDLLAAQRKLSKIGSPEAQEVLSMISPKIEELSAIEMEARKARQSSKAKKEVSVDDIFSSLVEKGFITE